LCTTVISALRKLRQEDPKSEASLCNISKALSQKRKEGRKKGGRKEGRKERD
jgi:hypothetical protein